MVNHEKDQLNVDLTRQLLTDYQELQRQNAFLKRSLKRTEGFLRDEQSEKTRVKISLDDTEKQKKRVLEIAKLAIERGEAITLLVDDMVDDKGLKEDYLRLLKKLNGYIQDIEIPF